MTDLAEEILSEVIGLLEPFEGAYRFTETPDFLLERLRAIPDEAMRRKVVGALARFGYVLAEEEDSSAASRTLMGVLERFVESDG